MKSKEFLEKVENIGFSMREHNSYYNVGNSIALYEAEKKHIFPFRIDLIESNKCPKTKSIDIIFYQFLIQEEFADAHLMSFCAKFRDKCEEEPIERHLYIARATIDLSLHFFFKFTQILYNLGSMTEYQPQLFKLENSKDTSIKRVIPKKLRKKYLFHKEKLARIKIYVQLSFLLTNGYRVRDISGKIRDTLIMSQFLKEHYSTDQEGKNWYLLQSVVNITRSFWYILDKKIKKAEVHISKSINWLKVILDIKEKISISTTNKKIYYQLDKQNDLCIRYLIVAIGLKICIEILLLRPIESYMEFLQSLMNYIPEYDFFKEELREVISESSFKQFREEIEIQNPTGRLRKENTPQHYSGQQLKRLSMILNEIYKNKTKCDIIAILNTQEYKIEVKYQAFVLPHSKQRVKLQKRCLSALKCSKSRRELRENGRDIGEHNMDISDKQTFFPLQTARELTRKTLGDKGNTKNMLLDTQNIHRHNKIAQNLISINIQKPQPSALPRRSTLQPNTLNHLVFDLEAMKRLRAQTGLSESTKNIRDKKIEHLGGKTETFTKALQITRMKTLYDSKSSLLEPSNFHTNVHSNSSSTGGETQTNNLSTSKPPKTLNLSKSVKVIRSKSSTQTPATFRNIPKGENKRTYELFNHTTDPLEKFFKNGITDKLKLNQLFAPTFVKSRKKQNIEKKIDLNIRKNIQKLKGRLKFKQQNDLGMAIHNQIQMANNSTNMLRSKSNPRLKSQILNYSDAFSGETYISLSPSPNKGQLSAYNSQFRSISSSPIKQTKSSKICLESQRNNKSSFLDTFIENNSKNETFCELFKDYTFYDEESQRDKLLALFNIKNYKNQQDPADRPKFQIDLFGKFFKRQNSQPLENSDLNDKISLGRRSKIKYLIQQQKRMVTKAKSRLSRGMTLNCKSRIMDEELAQLDKDIVLHKLNDKYINEQPSDKSYLRKNYSRLTSSINNRAVLDTDRHIHDNIFDISEL